MVVLGRRIPRPSAWAAVLALAAAGLFAGAFFAGRETAPGPRPAPSLVAAPASHPRLNVQPLSDAAPLPSLAPAVKPRIEVRTVSTPAKPQPQPTPKPEPKPHRSPAPVEIVGSG